MLHRNGRGERPGGRRPAMGAVPRRGPEGTSAEHQRRNGAAAGSFLQSLPLRLGALFVALLIAAALGVGYLFDRGRSQALEQRSLAFLRLHAERAADDLQRRLERLEHDTLFLARTPAVQGMTTTLGEASAAAGQPLAAWRGHLQKVFIAFAESRPDYVELRLFEVAGAGRELARVQRRNSALTVAPEAELGSSAGLYYVRRAASLPAGDVYLSRIDLDTDHGEAAVPMVRAATPVLAPQGRLVGVVVVDMDVRRMLDPLRTFIHDGEEAYLVDDKGHFLLTPLPDDAPVHAGLRDELIAAATAAARDSAPGKGGFFELGEGAGRLVGYVASRAFPAGGPGFRLDLILTEPAVAVAVEAGMMRRDSFLWMGALLLAAILLVWLMVRALTRSLRALAKVSEAIAGGDYNVTLPEVVSGEVGALTAAFQRMVNEVQSRERALAELNGELERRVEARAQDLSRQHRLHQLIVDNIGDGVIVADKAGRFLLWNRVAEAILGSGPPEVAPQNWPEHFGVYRGESDGLVPVDELPLVRAMRGEATEPVQLYLNPPGGGDKRWITATGRPLLGTNGTVEGGVITLVDVTAQKQLHRRLERNRGELARVGRLALTAEIAAAASHQLSQPIAAMATYAGAAEQLYRSGQLSDERLEEILGDMTRVASRAGDTLESLRALIRRRKVRLRLVEVNDLVSSALLYLEDRLREDNVAVSSDLGKRLPCLRGDSIELEQMLIQLVVNALDALQSTPRDSRSLHVSTRYDTHSDMIVIRVVDSGEGISPRLADRLFDPWFTTREDALGIGLSIARTIVENHGGRIGMEVKEMPGAVFKIELPAI